MEGRRRASNLEEGLRNTEIKRETDIRNSLGPQSESDTMSGSTDRPGRDSDAYGRETPGRDEDVDR